jgi:hypothetical protein
MSRYDYLSFALCASLFLAGGCMWSRVKINSADVTSRAGAVKPQVTKAQDLQKLVGQPPSNILPLKSGKQIYVYTCGESKTKAFDIILVSVSKTNTRMDSTYVLVNEQGVVEAVETGAASEIPWEWWAFGE